MDAAPVKARPSLCRKFESSSIVATTPSTTQQEQQQQQKEFRKALENIGDDGGGHAGVDANLTKRDFVNRPLRLPCKQHTTIRQAPKSPFSNFRILVGEISFRLFASNCISLGQVCEL